MSARLLSGNPPEGVLLRLVLCLIVLALAGAPFLFPGARALDVAARICVFIVLAASYDLLLGYTGIVSFAHTMFFGIGAYGVALGCSALGGHWYALLAGLAAALGLSSVLACLIGLFSLRLRTLFYAMITLAVAAAFQTLASQVSEWTGGEDGLSFTLPSALLPSRSFSSHLLFGVEPTGKLVSYYLIFGAAGLLFLALLRIVNSPFGRVLQAIRENDFRAEALGFRTVLYRTVSNIVAAGFATLAGALLALWLRYNSPDTSLSFEVMVDVLLMVVIGGMGTLYGSVLGVTVFILAQAYLQNLMQAAGDAASGLPVAGGVLRILLAPERWLLWLGVFFVLCIYYLPHGIIGRLAGKRIVPPQNDGGDGGVAARPGNGRPLESDGPEAA